MADKMMPLDEFLQLDTDQQVENLKRWKMTHTLKDIREAWNFKHSAQYYMLLKKLRIYERVVNKSDKFVPGADNDRLGRSDEMMRMGSIAEKEEPLPDHFVYQLNATLSGPELADKLEKAAYFLRGEDNQVSIKLRIEAAPADTDNETN